MRELIKPSKEELEKLPGVPSKKRLEKGPVAVIECAQRIPCNPCSKACPRGAITIGKDITELPRLDEKKCIGCGLCVGKCPGLAIFVVDKTYSKEKAIVMMPYEFLPVPKEGESVQLLNRRGEKRGTGEVVKIVELSDRTKVISVSVPKELAMEIRGIKVCK